MKNTFLLLLFWGLFSCGQNNNKKESNPPEKMDHKKSELKISLAQWSLHRALQDGSLDNLDFAQKAKDLGASGIEYVNQFFLDKATNLEYLDQLNANAEAAGIEQLLIMVDGEGDLASPDAEERSKAVENHKKWVDAAKYLGCHSIRVNLFGEMTDKEAWIKYAVNSLSKLNSYGKQQNIHILVENHGWMSSDADALRTVMEAVNSDNCGTLPDFGNWCCERLGGKLWDGDCIKEYNKYKGMRLLMPYAKAVSAKSYAFDENGNETTIDYKKMIEIIRFYNYSGYIGIEFEGEADEEEGVKSTLKLLQQYI